MWLDGGFKHQFLNAIYFALLCLTGACCTHVSWAARSGLGTDSKRTYGYFFKIRIGFGFKDIFENRIQSRAVDSNISKKKIG